MADQNVFSFSVKKADEDSVKLIERAKEHCRKTGRSFSFVVLEGLSMYEKEVLHGKRDQRGA